MMVPHFLGAKKGCVFGFGVVNIQNHISTNQFFTFQGVLLSNIGFFPTTRELRSTSCQFQSQISSTHRAARWNRRHFRRSTYQGRFGSRFYIIDVWCDHPKVWKKNNLMQVPFFSGPQRKKKHGKTLTKICQNWSEKIGWKNLRWNLLSSTLVSNLGSRAGQRCVHWSSSACSTPTCWTKKPPNFWNLFWHSETEEVASC